MLSVCVNHQFPHKTTLSGFNDIIEIIAPLQSRTLDRIALIPQPHIVHTSEARFIYIDWYICE